ncbi:tRNA lysidine(34) synthetase [Leptospira levettii]|uniref:tRNA(Ile)-lysidine synthetase n=1 Tax=Leptospira levettii TaxID=2023178 RepID=A0ABY2MR92_9LEPT|nr:tRNA(Ile)-lysidine synthetase [Leptospira sp. mixed culture ATI2-C-A1]TGL73320.1 tRNA(Ile)-lysidine synthetase [Leptospira levettii]TGM29252.1 tRNA(Ile)-lysidine synthetase [Leptospira levettii]TGM83989.1 tRNA(Ile)-lysidine synthetase [Leptospira levettii]
MPNLALKLKKGLEETGRLVRYHELKKITRKNPSVILTGHHCKDYTESIFLHLTRGGGKKSFYTLPPFDGERFLPLVFLEDQELKDLYEYVATHMRIFEDESNSDPIYKRNRIRMELLPILEREKWNFHKTYWNFHDRTQLNIQFDGLASPNQTISPKMFRIPHETWMSLTLPAKKELIDFHLKLMGMYPLYKSGFENFHLQSEGERAFLENKNCYLYKSKFGDLFIIDKKSSAFKKAISYREGNQLTIEWNQNQFRIKDPEERYSLGSWHHGQKIQIRSGNKEISECMRENGIPFFLRTFIPILYFENEPIQILFSLFSKNEKNYPKRIYLER